ncbi:MAG: thioredoxin domain-containing protein [Hellea sp.]|nr:thioredoxin domain-containing protein [Hellea sp.]
MFKNKNIDSLLFTAFVCFLSLIVTGCSDNKVSKSSQDSQENSDTSAYLIKNDHITGSKDAPITIVEYASVACGACANWHNQIYPELKSKYVDTGKVRYVFREFITGVPEYADAGFMIALCAPDENYFKNIALQFKRQQQIFKMGSEGKAREAYIGIAKSAGLSEDKFVECMQNQELRSEYREKMQSGKDMGINATPTFIINGKQEKVFTLDSIEEVILPLINATNIEEKNTIDTTSTEVVSG